VVVVARAGQHWVVAVHGTATATGTVWGPPPVTQCWLRRAASNDLSEPAAIGQPCGAVTQRDRRHALPSPV